MAPAEVDAAPTVVVATQNLLHQGYHERYPPKPGAVDLVARGALAEEQLAPVFATASVVCLQEYRQGELPCLSNAGVRRAFGDAWRVVAAPVVDGGAATSALAYDSAALEPLGDAWCHHFTDTAGAQYGEECVLAQRFAVKGRDGTLLAASVHLPLPAPKRSQRVKEFERAHLLGQLLSAVAGSATCRVVVGGDFNMIPERASLRAAFAAHEAAWADLTCELPWSYMSLAGFPAKLDYIWATRPEVPGPAPSSWAAPADSSQLIGPQAAGRVPYDGYFSDHAALVATVPLLP
eukprot:TRINITY_DN13749_c0_g1_i1.p1 TRINITY_DN13749_c0_g1~~TRINITY_DN13749_c0_g1_i1.p1  ORF type:complete len:292 (+),score=61.10 TRINITY_DN13749_c0_g1_i1:115-990(+)